MDASMTGRRQELLELTKDELIEKLLVLEEQAFELKIRISTLEHSLIEVNGLLNEMRKLI